MGTWVDGVESARPAEKRRWYDQKSELSVCVNLLEAFPARLRSVLLEAMVYMAERDCEAHLLFMSLRSLGAR